MKDKEKAVSVNNLTKKYGDIVAIKDLSFEINRGEVFSLVGPNGAGKTTTVEILECLKEPTSGSAEVLGLDIYEDEEKIKQNIGVMPQDFNTFDRLTAKENIQLMADIYGEEGIDDIIEKVGVASFENKRFNDLSGGMKTKVGIGMALVSKAELLFLDEPTSGLDPQARREIWSLIRDLKETGKTIVLTTHYMEEVEELSDRAAILIDGDIKMVDSIRNLIKKFGGEIKVTVEKYGEAEEIIRKNSDEIIKESNEELTGIFGDRKEARKTLISLFQSNYDAAVEEGGMDEVFLRLAGGEINERGELV